MIGVKVKALRREASTCDHPHGQLWPFKRVIQCQGTSRTQTRALHAQISMGAWDSWAPQTSEQEMDCAECLHRQ
jgi:hypothetical protein